MKWVLVTGVHGVYTVHGWILGQYGKRPEWMRRPNGGTPIHLVPKSQLCPEFEVPL